MEQNIDQSRNEKIDNIINTIGFSFLTMLITIFIGSTVLMIFKIPISKYHFPLLSLLGIVITSLFGIKEKKNINFKYSIFIYILYIAIVFLLKYFVSDVWDFSNDGRWYHQEAILRMMKSWNPIYSDLENINIWSYYYTKATWYLSAAINMFFNNVEAGKLYNIFFQLILSLISIPFFRKIANLKNYKLPIMFSVLLFLNPVSISQVYTYYVDGLLGIMLILLVINTYYIYNDIEIINKNYNYFLLFNIAAFTSHIKFTGLVYTCIILFIFLLYLLLNKKHKEFTKLFKFLSISFIIITVIIGYSPYVKNTLEKGNPFFPLMGKEKIDIMTTNTPEAIREYGMFKKATISYTTRPTTSLEDDLNIGLKDFFKFKNKYAFAGPDVRIRGFGNLSIFIFSLNLILLLYYLYRKSISKNGIETKKFFILVLFQFLIISLIGKEFWWARYISYMWFIIPLTLVLLLDDRRLLTKISIVTLSTLLLVNSFHFLKHSIPYHIEFSDNLKNEISSIKENSKESKYLFNDNPFFFWYEEKLKK